MRGPRIVLADDHQEMLELVARLIEGKFDIVATVETGQCAIEAVTKLNPDLVVLDISMPILDGFETVRRLRASGSRVTVVFLTLLEDRDLVAAAISIGVLGYVLKPYLITDLIPAIQCALQGELFCSPPLRPK